MVASRATSLRAPGSSNRCRGASEDDSATGALEDFGRFPTWMWRNTDVVAFVEWLRAHDDTQPVERRTGFYGIDLYSRNFSPLRQWTTLRIGIQVGCDLCRQC